MGGEEQFKPHTSQFISIFALEAVKVLDHIDGFADNLGQSVWMFGWIFSFIVLIATFDVKGVFDYGCSLVL
jgi:hypothetical protein